MANVTQQRAVKVRRQVMLLRKEDRACISIVAAEAGLDLPTFSRWMNGRTKISQPRLIAIENAVRRLSIRRAKRAMALLVKFA